MNYQTKNSKTEIEIKQQQLVKSTSVIGIYAYILHAIIYSYLDIHELWPASIVLLCFSALFILIKSLIKRNRYEMAKHILSVNISITVLIITALLIGPKPKIHFYFLVFALLPVLLWSFKHMQNLIIYFTLNVLLFFLVEFKIEPTNALLEFPDKYTPHIAGFTYAFSFLLIAYIIIIYQKLSENNEKKILEQTEKLNLLNKKLQLQKKELDKALATKDKYISILAHDLRNPINALNGFAELLSYKYHDANEEKRLRLINSIVEGSKNTKELLENLLDWSNLQTGKAIAHPANFVLDKLVMECLQWVEVNRRAKNIDIKNTINNNTSIYADRDMIATVIRNLLSNSLKYTPKNGCITISQEKVNNSHLLICIKDNGVGMKSETLNSIFSGSLSYSQKGTNQEVGTGVGLKLSKEFVEMNNGEIWAESTEGKGSSFYFKVLLP